MQTNAIDRAWYKQKVVTLVAFDLKGAFNGVDTRLDARLRTKSIPEVARRWIASFMSHCQANIGFDDFQTEEAPLENAGLAEGSPLSPILFAFFNCDPVDQPVDFHGGASAFIDDYFWWRVGWTAEEHLAKIQSEDIPRIEAWAQRTGFCFAAHKEARGTRQGSDHHERQRYQTIHHAKLLACSSTTSYRGKNTRSIRSSGQPNCPWRSTTASPRTDATAQRGMCNTRSRLRVDSLA